MGLLVRPAMVYRVRYMVMYMAVLVVHGGIIHMLAITKRYSPAARFKAIWYVFNSLRVCTGAG